MLFDDARELDNQGVGVQSDPQACDRCKPGCQPTGQHAIRFTPAPGTLHGSRKMCAFRRESGQQKREYRQQESFVRRKVPNEQDRGIPSREPVVRGHTALAGEAHHARNGPDGEEPGKVHAQRVAAQTAHEEAAGTVEQAVEVLPQHYR